MGTSINYMDTGQLRGRVSQMTILLHKPYLFSKSRKSDHEWEEGGVKIPKKPHGLWMTPMHTWTIKIMWENEAF